MEAERECCVSVVHADKLIRVENNTRRNPRKNPEVVRAGKRRRNGRRNEAKKEARDRRRGARVTTRLFPLVPAYGGSSPAFCCCWPTFTTNHVAVSYSIQITEMIPWSIVGPL